MKRLQQGLAIFLSILMIISFVPANVHAIYYLPGGNTVAEAPLITNETTNINLHIEMYADVYFKFIPSQSTTYTIKTIGSMDSYGYLLDDTQTELASNDDYVDLNFQLSYNLNAGRTYYLLIGDIYGSANMALSITGGGLYNPEAVPTELNISSENISITSAGASGGGLSSAEVMLNPKGYIITGSSTVNNITVSGVATSITLSNVNINVSSLSSSAFELSSSANVTLNLEGNNVLQGGFSKPGINVSTGNQLYIQGTGSLSVTGGSQGAGIGGGFNSAAGTITINSGNVIAAGGEGGAGIGGGLMGGGGTIRIYGGTVTAKGGIPGMYAHGSGIGGGGTVASTGADITISADANVNASSEGDIRPAIHGTINGATSAYILMANFESVQASLSTGIYLSGSSTAVTSFAPTYQSIAKTVSAGTYTLKTDGKTQMHTSKDFVISSKGLTTFNSVSDRPEIDVLSNSISIANNDTSPSTNDNTDFGEVEAGQSITKSFVIKNIGTADMDVFSITITGTDVSDFTVHALAPINIGADGSLSIPIEFNPTSAGNKSANLVIVSNDKDESTYTIALQGNVLSANPTVVSVSVPAVGNYIVGDNLYFTINFDKSVIIDTIAGTPYLTLYLNSSTVYAPYISGSVTSAITFRYTVASGDLDKDGITIGSFITLNGATIKSSKGYDAVLELNSIGNTAGIKVCGIKYTVKYSPGSFGTFTEQTTSNLSYGAATPAAPTVTGKAGYTFQGFSPDVASTVTGDATYTAVFTPNTNTAYKVNHYLENLDGSLTLDKSENLSGTTDTLVTAVLKTFTGFYAPSVAPSATISGDGSTIVNVEYKRNTYTVSFNSNDGTAVDPKTTKYKGVISAPSDPTKTGYTFKGWYKESTTINKWDFSSDTVAENITLYAKWEASTYSITYYLDGGTLGANTPLSYTFGTNTTLVNPTKAGYNFAGFYDNSSFTGSAKTVISTTESGNKELWAKWTAKNGISINQTVQKVTYDQTNKAFAISGTPTDKFVITYNQGGTNVVPKNAGSYNVVITRAEDSVYKEFFTTIIGGLVIEKAVPTIEFPMAQSANYGTKLFNIGLIGGSTLYGTFEWTNSSIVPTVINSGYSVTFTPNDTLNYDYSSLQGYDSGSNVLRRNIELSVLKAQITITAFSKVIKYGDAPSHNGASYFGFVNNENPSILKGASAFEYDYKQFDNVGAYTITPKGFTADNYDIIFETGQLTVEKADGTPINQTVYITKGKTTSFEVDLSSMLPEFLGATYGDITYGISSTTDANGILSGSRVDNNILKFSKSSALEVGNTASIEISIETTNYNFTEGFINIEVIEKESVNISGISVSSKNYDNVPVVITGTAAVTDLSGTVIDNYLPLIYMYKGTMANGETYESQTPPTNAGIYTLNIKTDSDDDNYMGETNVSFEISKATPSITFPTTSEVTYGALLSDVLLSGGSGSGDGNFSWSDSTIRPTVTNSGYEVVFTPSDPYNYDYSSGTKKNVEVKVNPKEATLTWSNCETRNYDGNKSNVTAQVSNLVTGDECTVIASGGDSINANTYIAKALSLSNNNYVLPNDATKQYIILKAVPVKIVFPTASSITYGGNLLSSNLTGGSGDGTFAWVNGLLKPTVVNNGYEVVFTPRDIENYDYTGVSLTNKIPLTINPFALSITAEALNKVYDGTNIANVNISDNRITGDEISITAKSTFESKDTGLNIKVNISDIALTGKDASNYTYNNTCQSSANILKKEVTVTADAKTKNKGDEDPNLTYTQIGLVNGELLLGNLVREAGETAGNYRILSKLYNDNYNINYTGNVFTINGKIAPVDSIGVIKGKIVDNSGIISPIGIMLTIGNNVVASCTADSTGNFEFANVKDGIYNIVADNGKYKVTIIVEVKDGKMIQNGQNTQSLSFTIEKTQSLIKISNDATPNVVVGGLGNWFSTSSYTNDDRDVVNNLGTAIIKLVAEEKQEANIEEDVKTIKTVSNGKTLGFYIDLSVEKTVIDKSGTVKSQTSLQNLDENLEIIIPIPGALKGKKKIYVYRLHDGSPELLSSETTSDEYYVLTDSYIKLYVKKFSIYAFGFTNKTSGGSGGALPAISINETNLLKQTVITLTPSKPNSNIYYTLDGSIPTANSIKYEKPLILKEDTTIKYFEEGSNTVVVRSFKINVNNADFIKNASSTKYIKAATSDKFEPDKEITRYDVAQSLFGLLEFDEGAVDTELKDVKADMKQIVAYFQSANIIDGFEDGSFKGDKALTRAEFVKILVNILGIDVSSDGASFSDTKGHWSEKYIAEFAKLGILKGYTDGTFRPDQVMTRAEFVAVINRIINAKTSMVPPVFSDLSADHWAYSDIMAVYIK